MSQWKVIPYRGGVLDGHYYWTDVDRDTISIDKAHGDGLYFERLTYAIVTDGNGWAAANFVGSNTHRSPRPPRWKT